MKQPLLKNMSLKTRVTLTVTFLFAVFVITASYFISAYYERHFKETVSSQQFSLVSILAGNIDDKLRIAQNSLIAIAASVSSDTLTNADKAQEFLDAQTGVKAIFDNVVFFMSKEGKLIAETPYKSDRRGKDLSFREYYKTAFATGKPYISSPFVSTHRPGHPSICITVPIYDDRRNLVGFLAGGIDLLGKNFLADLPNTNLGKSGYLFATDSNRIVIAHPDKARIMKLAALPGANKLYDRVLDGFEGSAETITSDGTPVISSYKRLGMTSWILGCSYPTSEAYGPLYKAKLYFCIVTVASMAMLLFVTWLIMRRIMSPLVLFTGHIKQLPNKTGEERHIFVGTNDEIGIMAAAFNSMIDSLDSQRDELQMQKKVLEDERQMLEKEVDEKHQAQEALIVKTQMLEELNQLLEERVAQAVADLRQKDRILILQSRQAAMGEMINNIAHQWRQPLNNLGLIVQNLQMVFEMGQLGLEEMNAQSKKAMETIMFMSRTIDDFRNYFRQDKEKIEFNVIQAVNRTISIVEGSLNNNQLAIVINTTDDPVVYGYPNEYSQVLLNIFNNARYALLEHGVRDPLITINICRENGKAVVTITDNAGGIPEDIIDKIFDPYFTTKGPDKGTGVGLFMSKAIIEKSMGGRLTVRNIGSGAEFRIEI